MQAQDSQVLIGRAGRFQLCGWLPVQLHSPRRRRARQQVFELFEYFALVNRHMSCKASYKCNFFRYVKE